MNERVDTRRIAALLSDPAHAEDPRTFPKDAAFARSAKLYSATKTRPFGT